jgi:hypothetical protein
LAGGEVTAAEHILMPVRAEDCQVIRMDGPAFAGHLMQGLGHVDGGREDHARGDEVEEFDRFVL